MICPELREIVCMMFEAVILKLDSIGKAKCSLR